MNEILGYNHFCSACKGSSRENGELICRDKNGKFYGKCVSHVLLAPCMKSKKTKFFDKIRSRAEVKENGGIG